jgi:putative flippase GtrA
VLQGIIVQRKYRRREAKAPLPDSAIPERRTLLPIGGSQSQARDASRWFGGMQMPSVVKARFLTAKLIRFGLVALLSATVYSVAVAALVSLLNFDGKLANVIGYVVAVPLNFIGHRRFTFLSKGLLSKEAIRFSLLHAVNIGVSTAGFGLLVDSMKLPFWFGILGVLVLVPISTFIIMDVWVFAEQGRPFIRD